MTQPHNWKWDGRVTVMDGQTLIAVLGTDGGPADIAERARLIEAAPRMLEALRGVLLWGTDENYEPARLACEEAREVIAAATKGQP